MLRQQQARTGTTFCNELNGTYSLGFSLLVWTQEFKRIFSHGVACGKFWLLFFKETLRLLGHAQWQHLNIDASDKSRFWGLQRGRDGSIFAYWNTNGSSSWEDWLTHKGRKWPFQTTVWLDMFYAHPVPTILPPWATHLALAGTTTSFSGMLPSNWEEMEAVLLVPLAGLRLRWLSNQWGVAAACFIFPITAQTLESGGRKPAECVSQIACTLCAT